MKSREYHRKSLKRKIVQWKRMGQVSLQKVEILVETWKMTFLSTTRHFKPLGLCWKHHLHRSTASTFAEGRQQHLLAQRLINWLIGRPRCKLIDWSSCGWNCLYLEPWGANLWRSPVICHVQHTGEEGGEMKSCGFITETWGACMKEVSAKMGTGGMPREQWGQRGWAWKEGSRYSGACREEARYRHTWRQKEKRSVAKLTTTSEGQSCP